MYRLPGNRFLRIRYPMILAIEVCILWLVFCHISFFAFLFHFTDRHLLVGVLMSLAVPLIDDHGRRRDVSRDTESVV